MLVVPSNSSMIASMYFCLFICNLSFRHKDRNFGLINYILTTSRNQW
nr:MAG TPA: hypothetical protein [Caudoviricetes sp.]